MAKQHPTFFIGSLAAAVFACFTFAASAQQGLSTAQIDRWIASMAEVNTWAEQQGLDEETLWGDDDAEDSMTNFSEAFARLGKHQAGLERIVRRHGFADTESWADTSHRVATAWLTLMWEVHQPEMQAAYAETQAEIREQMAAIERDPGLSPEQKAQFREQMQAAVDMFEQPAAGPAASEVNPADMAAVRARRAQLDAFFQAQNEGD